MSGEGIVMKDLVDDSDELPPVLVDSHPSASDQRIDPVVSQVPDDRQKGSAQVPHRQEVDLGWNIDHANIPNPMITGVDNEDVWILIRRFNNQIFHVKQSSKQPIGGLDLNASSEEEFSPNKLRSQFERMYMGLIVGSLTFYKHVIRVRSWKETRRTAALCIIYFAAWTVNRLTSILILVGLILMLSPTARRTLFPPAPLALIDYSTGGVTRPAAGTLGSEGTATGAPENWKGEALENEASNFITGISAIALNTTTGGDPQGEAETEGKSMLDSMPNPESAATIVATAKDKAEGVDRPSGDKSKAPMEQMMWAQMRPLMHLLTLVSDVYERCAHMLSPVPPFSRRDQEIRIAGLLTPLLVGSWFLTANVIFRLATLFIGIGIFGDPMITRGLEFLDRVQPDWKQIYHINNTLFKGVPTDAQLALTLLRVGERHKAPLPPPPKAMGKPSEKPLKLSEDVLKASGGDQPLGATPLELHEASRHHEDAVKEAGGNDDEMTSTTTDSNRKSKILSFVKGGFKGAVKAGISIDKVRAKAGTESAKQRIGVMPKKNQKEVLDLRDFECRFHGKPGIVKLDPDGSVPSISFYEENTSTTEKIGLTDNKGPQLLWTIPINQIMGLMKHSGYGFKSKLFSGWAMDRGMRDSLGISDANGKEYVLTAMPFRDELFNRLCSIGGQTWEVL